VTDWSTSTLALSDWPKAQTPRLQSEKTEALIERILEWLTPAQKVGQIIQADIAEADDPGYIKVRRLQLGKA